MAVSERLRFEGKIVAIAKREFNASCEDPDAEAYLARLYEEYTTQGAPHDLDGWIRKRLQGEFRSVDDPPVWIGDEPAWPYHRGNPMVFITQLELKKNVVTENHLTWDAVVYLFGARLEMKEHAGYRLEFREVIQQFRRPRV